MAAIRYYASNHEACSTARTVRVATSLSSDPQSPLRFERVDGVPSSPQPDFVWLNTPTRAAEAMVSGATVYNHLSGCSVFEDKAKMALLQERMSVPTLTSRVFKSAVSFALWCRRSAPTWTHLWVAKNPMANSGIGVWMLGPQNWESVVAEVTAAACAPSSSDSSSLRASAAIAVVVQRYVDRPLLFRGRKLQLRLYVVVTGDLSVWVYRHGLIQVCNKPFVGAEEEGELAAADFDSEVHITNVCRNKDNAALFLAEQPTDVAVRYPVVFAHAKRVLADMVRAARPYLARQRSAHHFEYMGVDFIADAETGYSWLIECNLPPNNVGSTMSEGSAIETFHQTTWSDLIQAFVLPPIVHGRRCCSAAECGLWERAAAPLADLPFAPALEKSVLASNHLTWLLFQKKTMARQRANASAAAVGTVESAAVPPSRSAAEGAAVIDFGSGSPAPSLLASDVIQRASLLLFDAERRRLPADDAATKPRHALQYGSPGGDPHEWLPALSRFLTTQSGRQIAPERLVTTAGCSHALDLLCSACTVAGDVALVEDPTYNKAIETLQGRQLDVRGVRSDGEGLIPDALEEAIAAVKAEGGRIACVYFVPTFNNPRGTSYSTDRIVAILQICAHHDVLAVADDPYRFLSHATDDARGGGAKAAMDFALEHLESAASTSDDASAPPTPRVAVLGSFSKFLGPGLRAGWIESFPPALAASLNANGVLRSGGCIAQFSSCVIGCAMHHGLVTPHLRATRCELARRGKLLHNALAKHLPPCVRCDAPCGGYFLWVEMPPNVMASELLALCRATEAVSFRSGELFSASGAFTNCIRLSFSKLDDGAMVRGAAALGRAMASILEAKVSK